MTAKAPKQTTFLHDPLKSEWISHPEIPDVKFKVNRLSRFLLSVLSDMHPLATTQKAHSAFSVSVEEVTLGDGRVMKAPRLPSQAFENADVERGWLDEVQDEVGFDVITWVGEEAIKAAKLPKGRFSL